MTVKFSDVASLPLLQNIRIVTGTCGFQNSIESIGILDYEFVENTPDQFSKGDLLISSFLFAKDNEELLTASIKRLIQDKKVVALGIKDVYYKELSAEIVLYAQQQEFPIFLFDNSIFFEDIITNITDLIHFSNQNELLERKVDLLLDPTINKVAVLDLAQQINRNFKEWLIVIVYETIKYTGQNYFIKNIEPRNSVDSEHSLIAYKNGLVGIFTFAKEADIDEYNLLHELNVQFGVRGDEVYIGISNRIHGVMNLDKGIKEGVYACKTNRLTKKDQSFFKDIGLYKLLIPYMNDFWVSEFYQSLLIPLQKYDETYNTTMFSTAICYVDNNCNIKKTADVLFQHENTIRYRIGKITEILSSSGGTDNLKEQLIIAIKIYQLKEILL